MLRQCCINACCVCCGYAYIEPQKSLEIGVRAAREPPQSFLLRLWREQADAPLRATLIPVAQPQTPRHFATLEALHASLCAEC